MLCEDDGLPVRISGNWAQDKLHYVKAYIDTFEISMRNKWKKRIYVDLFAGPGKCKDKDSGEFFLGSPLLALTTKYPFTDYFFVEMDGINIETLRKRVKSADISEDNIHCLVGNANEKVSEIAREIKKCDNNSINLAFLDPEGFELDWKSVAELAKCRRMDLIINYSQGGLERAIKNCLASDNETSLDKFFGNDEWRKIYLSNANKPCGFHRPLIDFYISRLQELQYVEVKEKESSWTEPLMRNKNNVPLYRLLFASKHPLGEKFWKDITSKTRSGQSHLL